jgi:hypothetical protein
MGSLAEDEEGNELMELFMVLSLLGAACAISLARAATIVIRQETRVQRERREERQALGRAARALEREENIYQKRLAAKVTGLFPLYEEEQPETEYVPGQITMSPATSWPTGRWDVPEIRDFTRER